MVSFSHSSPYYSPTGLNIWCMIFIGMALVLIGYGITFPVNSYAAAWVIVRGNFDPVIYSFGNSTYDPGRLSIALGYLGLIMPLAKAGWFRRLLSRLAAIGQVQLSHSTGVEASRVNLFPMPSRRLCAHGLGNTMLGEGLTRAATTPLSSGDRLYGSCVLSTADRHQFRTCRNVYACNAGWSVPG